MLKQLICWLKTGHMNRKPQGLFIKRFNFDGEIVYKKYKCLDCGYKGKEHLIDRAYWND